MLNRSPRLKLFRDSLIELQVPEYLDAHETDGVSYVFETSARQAEDTLSLVILGRDGPDEAGAADMYLAQQQQLMSQPGFQDTKWLHWKVLRSGKCNIIDGAFELVSELTDSRRKTVEYCWQVAGVLERHVFHMKMSAVGIFAEDEPTWHESLRSLRIVGLSGTDIAPTPSGVSYSERSTEPSDATDLQELERSLSTLPTTIRYLAAVLLELAAMPEEELCDEDTNLTQLEAAIDTQLGGKQRSARRKALKDQAKVLKEWSSQIGKPNDRLNNAVSAVIGFMIGECLYG